jgi:hypothetical protein
MMNPVEINQEKLTLFLDESRIAILKQREAIQKLSSSLHEVREDNAELKKDKIALIASKDKALAELATKVAELDLFKGEFEEKVHDNETLTLRVNAFSIDLIRMTTIIESLETDVKKLSDRNVQLIQYIQAMSSKAKAQTVWGFFQNLGPNMRLVLLGAGSTVLATGFAVGCVLGAKTGAQAGAVAGGAVAGPLGAAVGTVLGATFGGVVGGAVGAL